MKTNFLKAAIIVTLVMFANKSFSQKITFNINLTGYSIGSGGVHLAGTFASTGCESITSDWDPNAPGSEMEYLGSGIYRLTVYFSEISVGQQLQFLVVRNNIWYDNYEDYSEGNPGETHLDNTCGFDDNYGGYNRLITIPEGISKFNANFDYCGDLITCLTPTGLYTSDITSTTAVLNWDSELGGIFYRIKYFAPSIGNSAVKVQIDADSASYHISNLSPGTEYSWKIKKLCSGNANTPWSEFIYFTTPPEKLSDDRTKISAEIFPNPANANVNVRFNLANTADVQIKIIDLLGREVKSVSISQMSSGWQQIDLDVAELTAGNYLVAIKTDLQTETIKLAISK